jgi:ABC-type Fe3+ transport system substrate-binding protein
MVRQANPRALTVLLSWVAFSGICLDAAPASDTVRILTSQSQALRTEFARGFGAYYRKNFGHEAKVLWLDQGSDIQNFHYAIQHRGDLENAPFDLIWGGSTESFEQLHSLDMLMPMTAFKSLGTQLERLVIPARMRAAKDGSWATSMLSGVGIMVNWAALKEKTSDLGTGARELTLQSLTLPGFKSLIQVIDPRHSPAFAAVCASIVRNYGWDNGMQLIESFFVHSRTIANRDIAALEAVSRGRIGATFALDRYALEMILNQNRPELEFAPISDAEDLIPEPIAIIRRDKNTTIAQRFVQYLFSREGQGLLQLSKGAPGGPTEFHLGRIAVRSDIGRGKSRSYSNPINAFSTRRATPSGREAIEVPPDMISTLVGSIYVDQHANWLRLEDLNPPRNANMRRDVWLGVAFLPKSEDLPKFIERWKQPKTRERLLESLNNDVANYFAKRLQPLGGE